MKTSKLPRPPSHLRPATKTWWKTVVETYQFGDSDLKVLTLAAEALDAHETARLALAKEGTTYLDRYNNPRLRPENNVLRDSALVFARLVKQLQLDVPEPAPGNRRR